MVHISKDKNMNQYRKTSGSLKQGYLHIKRERTASMFAKPWQQGYFILRCDPFLMEEYKDASLKTKKQLHSIGSIRHVGIIRTSKSQQYAFEVVMKEKSSLLLACENEILLEEWINTFIEVMNTDVEKPNVDPEFNNTIEKGKSATDTFQVIIVESALSRSNELSGEYYFVMTPSRMTLLDYQDMSEVLSWPNINVTCYSKTPNMNQINLTMGRQCHFGSGELIFKSSKYEQILKCIELNQSRGKSLISSSYKSNSSLSTSYKTYCSPLGTSYDDESSVFNQSYSEHNIHRFMSLDVKAKSYSFSDICQHENIHKKLQRSKELSPVKTTENELTFPEIVSEDGYILPNDQDINEELKLRLKNDNTENIENINTNEFPPSSNSPSVSDNENEFSYLQIVDSDENVDDPVAKRVLDDITSSLTNPVNNPSHLFNINCKKKSPTNTTTTSEDNHTTEQSPKQKYAKELRRCSEPMRSRLDKDHSKLKNYKKGSHSVDTGNHTDYLSKSHNSPQMLTKYHQQSLVSAMSLSCNNKTALPKQHSISQGSLFTKLDKMSTNPFGNTESLFLKNPNRSTLGSSQSANMWLKRSGESVLSVPFKSPELDRNMKPKPNKMYNNLNGQNNSENIVNKGQSISEETPTLPDDSTPPPVPERQSPKGRHRCKLQYSRNLHEEGVDCNEKKCKTDSNEDDRHSKSYCEEEHLQSNSDLAGQVQGEEKPEESDSSSVNSEQSGDSGFTSQKLKGMQEKLLLAPPLPPKSKPLSSTRSAPIPGREEEKDCRGVRASSFTSNSVCSDTGSDCMDGSNSSIVRDVGEKSGEEENFDIPPEVPRRLPVHSLVKRKHISTSEGNLLKQNFKELKPLRKLPSGSTQFISTHSSKTYDNGNEDLHKGSEDRSASKIQNRRSTIHDVNNSFLNGTDDGIQLTVMPKAFSPLSMSFPKAPKKFL